LAAIDPALQLSNPDGVLAYFDPTLYAIVTRTAARIDGIWSEPVIQVKGGDWGATDGTYAQIYGGYIHPSSTLDNLHLIVSQWNTAAGIPYHALQFKTSVVPAGPVYTVGGAIGARYNTLGADTGPLGDPVGNEYDIAAGRAQDFEHGRIYAGPSTGAWETYGLIAQKYQSLGGPAGVLGWPTSGELGTPNGQGRFNRFVQGNIYFNPQAGTHSIYGAISRSGVAVATKAGGLGSQRLTNMPLPTAARTTSKAAGSDGSLQSVGS